MFLKSLIQKKKEILGINNRNIRFVYPENDANDYKFADDKVLMKSTLEKHLVPCPITFSVIERSFEIKQKWDLCKQYSSMAIKPAKGSGGGGIMIIHKNKNSLWLKGDKLIEEREVLQHISCVISGMYSKGESDKCLIEECVAPHSFFNLIYPNGVPDFRVITYKCRPIMAMLRMPTSRSKGLANLHQGGVGIGIDMVNGRLKEVYNGKSYSNFHPDNSNPLTGIQVPFWNEILELSIMTAQAIPLNYLGVDLVIDREKGPLIMEVNARPGLAIQMVNRIGLNKLLCEHDDVKEIDRSEKSLAEKTNTEIDIPIQESIY